MSRACDRLFTGGVLFLVFFTPFAFGAVHPWAYTTMEVVIFSLVVVWMSKVIIARGQRSDLGGQIAEVGDQTTEVGGQRSEVSGQSRFEIRNPKSEIARLAIPLGLFILLCLFQLVPLPPEVLRVLSPKTYEFYTHVLPGWPQKIPYAELVAIGGQRSDVRGQKSEVTDQTAGVSGQNQSKIHNTKFEIPQSFFPATWLPLSLSPFFSKLDLLKFVAYAALFFLVLLYPFEKPFEDFGFRTSDPGFFVLSPEQRFLRSVFIAVLMTGLLVAALGFIDRFTNGNLLSFFAPEIWGEPRPNDLPRASAPFVNPDHFANYLALIFPLALSGSLFSTFVVSKTQQNGFKIFCGFTAFLLFTGMLLSLSRGGWMSALLGVVILVWLSPWHDTSQSAKRRAQSGRNSKSEARTLKSVARITAIVFCFLLIVSLLFVGSGGREQVDARLGETFERDLGLAARMMAWRDSVPMIRDFPLFGVGLGAWQELILRYQPGPWFVDVFRQAHNDYVEVLAETGPVGFGLLGWFFVLGGNRLYQAVRKRSWKTVPLIAGILAALGGMALHESLDFSLQIPSNAFLFALLFAVGLRMARDQRSEVRDQLSDLNYEPFAIRHTQSPITPEWSEVRDHKSEVGGEISDSFLSKSTMRNWASRLAPYAVSGVAVLLAMFALSQTHSLEAPESLAEARERILARPSKASYHMAVLSLAGDRAPVSFQLNEYKAALWIEPTNPAIRDWYASTLLSMGRTDEGLREMVRAVAEAPSLRMHEYLKDDSFLEFSPAEQRAVEEGFKQAVARDYPEAVDNLATFYTKFNRFSDQGALYEQAALKQTEAAKKADLLTSAGLAYLKAAEQIRNGKGDVSSRSSILDPRASIEMAQSSVLSTQSSRGPQSSVLNAQFSVMNAERVFRAAIETNPTQPKPYQQLVTAVYGARRDLAAAKEIVSDGIQNGASALPLYLSLAEAAKAAGSLEERKAALESANAEVEKLVKDGQNPYTLYIALADGARQAGDHDEETAALSKALELQPRSPDVLSRLANLYFDKRNFHRAALYLNRIIQVNPDSADLYYLLALAEEGRYQFAAAARAYARAVKLAPDNQEFQHRYDEFKRKLTLNENSPAAASITTAK